MNAFFQKALPYSCQLDKLKLIKIELILDNTSYYTLTISFSKGITFGTL